MAAAGLLAAALLAPPLAHAAPMPSGVAWLTAAADADVDAAFARARKEGKPLLLYWGATWCPPCNQLKATLFNRADFAQQARTLVMVHVDGDRPGAQKLGTRFSVTGYPTLVLFKPDGTELSRLPGEADAADVLELMRQGLAGGRGVQAVLADARAGRALSADEWRLLAFHSWETADRRLLEPTQVASVLATLAPAAQAANADAAPRLWLRALAASDDGKGLVPDDALRERVRQWLADPARARSLADVIANQAPELVRALGATPEARAKWVAGFDPVLVKFEGDASLSRADRLSALVSRIELARLELPKNERRPSIPEPLLAEVRAHVAALDRGITDPHERQAVMPSAAYALERAGLWREGEALLQANLSKSVSPYYLMSQLGSMARKQGRNDDALRWSQQAWEKSEGPATRLQWGAGYLQTLVDLAPKDSARIERVAARILDDAARDEGAFHMRSARALERVGKALRGWARDQNQAKVLARLDKRLAPVCRRVDEAEGRRAQCSALLRAAPAAAG